MRLRVWVGSAALVLAVVAVGAGLAYWKVTSIQKAIAAASNQPEPMEAVTVAVAQPREHRQSATAVGTVLALRSITLRNELAGTVRQATLTPGQVVEAGTVLVALDTSVEEAELKAQLAQSVHAEAVLGRARRGGVAVTEDEVSRAQAEYDVTLAQVARTRAIITRKTLRAPFKARIGISDVHPGQYLNEGTTITSLQGVDGAAHVDFMVAQAVAAGLKTGDLVDVFSGVPTAIPARVVAVDARVDPATRNAMIRARFENAAGPAPGSAVRVRLPVGPPISAVAVPASALRKGAGGDHVFVIAADPDGKLRAKVRPVEVGTVVGDDVLIVGGLAAGDRVAASGSFKLRDGILVGVAGDGK